MDKIQELGHLLGVYEDSRIKLYWNLKNLYTQGFYLYGVNSPWGMSSDNLLKMINKFVYQNNKNSWFTLDEGIFNTRNTYADFIYDITRINFKIYNDDLIEFYEFSNSGKTTTTPQIITFNEGLNKLGSHFPITKLGGDINCKKKYNFVNNFFIRLVKNGNTRNLVESQFTQANLDKLAHSLISQIKDNAEKSLLVSISRLEFQSNKSVISGKHKINYDNDWKNRVIPLIKHCNRLGYSINFDNCDIYNLAKLKEYVKEQFKNFPLQNFGMYDILELDVLKNAINKSQLIGADQVIGAWKYPYRDNLIEVRSQILKMEEKYKKLTEKNSL